MDLRNSRYWDRQLEGNLPDSRLRYSNREKATVNFGRLTLEKVFCANCGADGGAVTPEFAAHVFYVCEPCAMRLGPPPGCIEVHPETEN